MKKKRKEKKGKRNSVQELLGIRHFTNYGLMTDNGELVFFRVAPTNISVLSSVNIQQKILGLTNLLKSEPDMRRAKCRPLLRTTVAAIWISWTVST